MSGKTVSLQSKLADIQSKLHVPKSQHNKFGGYNYRSCEDICTAVKPLLAEHGLRLQMSDEVIEVAGRIYVRSEAGVSDGTESVVCFGWAREEETKKGMDGAQITGAASSYARKYALNGLFAIDDTKDADATNQGSQSSESKPSQQRKNPKLKYSKWVAGWVDEVNHCSTVADLKMMRGILDDQKANLTPKQYEECIELGKARARVLTSGKSGQKDLLDKGSPSHA